MQQRGNLRRARRLLPTAALAAIVLASAACGSQRSLEDIAAAARGDGGVTSAPAAAGTTLPGVTGSSDGSPGAFLGTGGDRTAGPATPGTTGPAVSGAAIGTPEVGRGAGGTVGATGPAGTGTTTTTRRAPGAGAGPTPPAVTGGPKATIKIGNVGDYNGLIGAIVGDAPLALQVWARAVNDAGGINGHPVQVIVGNTGSDPARQASLVRDMVENQGVVAFVSNMDPLSVTGGLKYLEERRIPVIGGDVVTELWNQSPILFPQATGIRPLILAILDVAVHAEKPKIAWLYCAESDLVCGFANRVITKEGGAQSRGATIVYGAQVSIAQPSFTAECLQAQRAGAQTVMAFVDAASLNRLSRDCRQQGFTPLYTTGSIGVNDSLAGNPDLVGLRAPVTVFPWMAEDVEPAVRFHRAMAKYLPSKGPTSAGAIGWASAELFGKVARAAGEDLTPAGLLRALGTIKGDTLGGATPPLTFLPGRPTPASTCYFVVEMSPERKWSAPQGSKQICL